MYHYLPELKLRIIFSALHIFNINLPEEGVQVLLSEKGLRELPDDSPNIFKKSNIITILRNQVQHFAMENTVC